MKKTNKLFGIIALVAVIGFTMAGCGPGDPHGGEDEPKGGDTKQLTVPYLSISGTSLTWNAVSNASGYTVDIDGTESQANTNSYSLSGLTTPKTYTIKVKTKGNGTAFTDSAWSSTVDYTVNEPTPGLLFTSIDGGTAYEVSRGTVTTAAVVTIPPVYNALPVTAVAAEGFRNYTLMTSITIPDSVTVIGNGAFSGCTGLKSITIPFVGATLSGTSNTHFGYIFGASGYSGQNSSIPLSLETVVITGGNIADSAFSGCTGLTGVTICNSVTGIGNGAFSGCTGLTGISIPFTGANRTDDDTGFRFIFGSTITDDGNDYIPSSLKTVTITGDSIASIAFSGCTGLTSITIGNSVTRIDYGAFEDCTNLTSVTFATGSNITNFGWSAFPGAIDTGESLRTAYLRGDAGTYTREADGTWTKQ
jgi:hypothetical protein